MKADEDMAATIRKCIAVCPFDGGVQIEFHACGVDFEAVLDRAGNLQEVSCLPAESRPINGKMAE